MKDRTKFHFNTWFDVLKHFHSLDLDRIDIPKNKTFPTNFPTYPNVIHKNIHGIHEKFVDDILISWKICGKSFDSKVNRYFILKYSSRTYDGYVWISILHRMKRYGLICGYIIFIKLSFDMILYFEIKRDYKRKS